MTPLEKLPPALRLRARAAGALAENRFRVVVIESDDRVSTRDFDALDEAIGHADDAASESDHPTPVAYVVDHELTVLHRGRHYAE